MCRFRFTELAMAAVAVTRTDLSAAELRTSAARMKDARAVRRTLAIALVLDGTSRAAAAAASGMDRQTLRDWVHRYNAGGLDGLSDQWASGPEPALTQTQEQAVNRPGFAGGQFAWVTPPWPRPQAGHSNAPRPRPAACCRSARGGGGCCTSPPTRGWQTRRLPCCTMGRAGGSPRS